MVEQNATLATATVARRRAGAAGTALAPGLAFGLALGLFLGFAAGEPLLWEYRHLSPNLQRPSLLKRHSPVEPELLERGVPGAEPWPDLSLFLPFPLPFPRGGVVERARW